MHFPQFLYRLTWYEPCWLLLLGSFVILPGKVLPLPWHPYLVVALFLFWPLRWLHRHQQQRDQYQQGNRSVSLAFAQPSTLAVMVILLWLPINLWASADRRGSWVAAGYLLWGIALFVALLNWPPVQRHPQRIAWLLLLCGVGLALVSPPLVAWKAEFRLFHLPLYDKLTTLPIDLGETIHANVLAGVLVLVLPLLLALALQKSSQILFSLLFLFVAGVLVLTQSRGGYVAVAVALPLVVILRWPRLWYGLLPTLILVMLLIRWVGVPFLLDQLSTDSSLGGWEGRLDIWQNSLHALADFAFTGIGIGTFTLVMPLLYPLQVSIEGYPHAHNLFLQIGLDLGLPGLIAYVAILINLFVMLISTLRSRHTLPLHRTLAIGATGSLVGMLVHGLLDAVTWGTKLAFVPWVLFALITQLFLYTKATQANPGSSS